MSSSREGRLERVDPMDGRQFEIGIRRLADSLSYGTDHSRFLGSGIEYVQSRPYEAGDPVRNIDWRVTARTDKFYIKEFESTKRMPCYLLFDTSASMTISSHAKSKYATALHIAGGLAFACLDRVSPVGIVGVGESGLRMRPSLSKAQIMQWLTGLCRFRYDESTSLARQIRELSPSLTQRVLIIVLSDLHDAEALLALKRLVQLHDLVVLQFQDPAEEGVRGSGFVRAREAETGQDFVSRGGRGRLDQDLVNRELRRSGIDHLRIRTDRPYVHALRHFFEARGVLGRTAR